MNTVLHFGMLKLVTARYKIGYKQLRPKTKKLKVLSGRLIYLNELHLNTNGILTVGVLHSPH